MDAFPFRFGAITTCPTFLNIHVATLIVLLNNNLSSMWQKTRERAEFVLLCVPSMPAHLKLPDRWGVFPWNPPIDRHRTRPSLGKGLISL